jgi:hypothetical protein
VVSPAARPADIASYLQSSPHPVAVPTTSVRVDGKGSDCLGSGMRCSFGVIRRDPSGYAVCIVIGVRGAGSLQLRTLVIVLGSPQLTMTLSSLARYPNAW